MPATFNAQPLFSSGPHRFQEGPTGEQLLSNGRLFPTNPGSQPIGPLEPTVTIRGRLVAPTESALWALRDAIAAQLTHPPTRADLTDHRGRTWPDMDFVNFTPADRTDRGRVFSLTYQATFTRLQGAA